MSQPKIMPTLTPRQLQLVQLIRQAQTKGCSATISELAQGLKLGRTTTYEHLEQLREKGLIESQTSKARSLKLTRLGQNLLNSLEKPFENPPCQQGIPLLGRVAAGRPIDAIEDRRMLNLNAQFAGSSKEIFALEIQGQSMIEDGISDGDYVICKRASDAVDGQIVIALVDGQSATVKRIYREQNRVRLEPANPDFAPIYTTDCQVQGIVVGLVRQF